MNAVVDAYNALTSNMPKIRDHLSELRGKVKVLDGGTDFQMKGAHRLLIGDEFVGDSRQAIDRVAKTCNELLVNWPNQLGKLIKDWDNGRFADESVTTHAKLLDGISDLLDRAFRGMQSINPTDREKVPSGFINSTRVSWSGPLPGNRALYIGVNRSGDEYAQSDVRHSVKINFSAIPGYATDSDTINVATPTAGEAIAIIRELEKLTHFVDDAKKGMTEIKKLGEAAFNESSEDFFDSGDNVAKAKSGLLVMALSQGTAESQNQFFGYVTGMIKSYMGYLSASLKAEGGANAAIEGESTRIA